VITADDGTNVQKRSCVWRDVILPVTAQQSCIGRSTEFEIFGAGCFLNKVSTIFRLRKRHRYGVTCRTYTNLCRRRSIASTDVSCGPEVFKRPNVDNRLAMAQQRWTLINYSHSTNRFLILRYITIYYHFSTRFSVTFRKSIRQRRV